MEESRPVGRPSKYKPEYCEMLVTHMGLGMTFTSFAGHPDVRVNADTLYEWVKVHPDFSESQKRGKSASEFHFMDIGHSSMTDKQNFNTTMWYMMMKNIHGWRDKVEQTVEHQGTIKIDKQDEGL